MRYGESLIITRGMSPESKYLEMYSPKAWEEKMAAIEQAFPEGKLKNNFIRWFVSTAESCELDTQNRIRIPQHLIDYCGIDKDVVLLGCVDRIEVWAKERLEETETMTEDDFESVFGFLNDFKKSKIEG